MKCPHDIHVNPIPRWTHHLSDLGTDHDLRLARYPGSGLHSMIKQAGKSVYYAEQYEETYALRKEVAKYVYNRRTSCSDSLRAPLRIVCMTKLSKNGIDKFV